MLEKYSTDLEGIVAERTSELEIEKAKTEELVCRMLPKQVYLCALCEYVKKGLDYYSQICELKRAP